MGRFQIFVGGIIGVGWLSSLVDGFATNDYHAFDLTMPLMAMLSGYVFGEAIIRKRISGGTSDDGH